jgi:hypothetical protein
MKIRKERSICPRLCALRDVFARPLNETDRPFEVSVSLNNSLIPLWSGVHLDAAANTVQSALVILKLAASVVGIGGRMISHAFEAFRARIDSDSEAFARFSTARAARLPRQVSKGPIIGEAEIVQSLLNIGAIFAK